MKNMNLLALGALFSAAATEVSSAAAVIPQADKLKPTRLALLAELKEAEGSQGPLDELNVAANKDLEEAELAMARAQDAVREKRLAAGQSQTRAEQGRKAIDEIKERLEADALQKKSQFGVMIDGMLKCAHPDMQEAIETALKTLADTHEMMLEMESLAATSK